MRALFEKSTHCLFILYIEKNGYLRYNVKEVMNMKDLFKINKNLPNGLALNYEWSGDVCSLTLSNSSDKVQSVGDITIFEAEMMFSPDTRVYGEGYNMLSQYGGTVEDSYLIGSFSDYDHYKLPKPQGINQVYNMAMFFPSERDTLLVGFASCRRFNGWIRFNKDVLQLALNCENITLDAGKTIDLEQIYIKEGERNGLLKDFALAIEKNHPKREFGEIPTGWCSWLVYGPNITAKNIYDNLDAIKENSLDLKYIQIDDGYQEYWGDWFNFTDKFEGGVQQICLDIKEKGFEPAIWVAPFVAEKDSRVFKNHPDWFVKDEEGKPLSSGDVSFGGWRCAPWYILDTTHPEALEYIKTVFRTMRSQWQIKYFKLDAIVWEALPFGVRYDRTKTSVEAFRIGMQAIAESVGEESYILGGNSPMWPSIGEVNGMRVTNDNARGWHIFKQLGIECFNRSWQHNRLWINDPDTVLLQNQMIEIVGPDGTVTRSPGTVTDDEFKFNAAYTMASGGMVLSSDDVSGLTRENIEILRRLLPPTRAEAEFDDLSFTVGRARIDEETTIIYLFNFDDFKKDICVQIDGKWQVFDHLENESLGICENEISVKELRPHYARVLVCKKAN